MLTSILLRRHILVLDLRYCKSYSGVCVTVSPGRLLNRTRKKKKRGIEVLNNKQVPVKHFEFHFYTGQSFISDMAMLCICGICIPYTVLWPIVVLFLKQIWSFIFPAAKADNKEPAGKASAGDDKIETGVLHNYTSDMNWEGVISGRRPTIFRFTAKWCKPCKSLDPLVEELCHDASGKAVFYNVDVDDCDEVAALNGAITIPLFVCYSEGKEVGRVSGSDDAKIRKFVRDSCIM
jgi:thioredoxin 1